MSLYRSRDGLFLGVCQGIADYFNVSAFWLRVLVLGLTLFTAFWPVFLGYVFLALLLKTEPLFNTEHVNALHKMNNDLELLFQRASNLTKRLSILENNKK